jgi:indolepyruvate ferredoxin oxidoreductase, beta subunit
MTEIVICGRGGQGIVFLTRQIGRIFTEKGMDVISSETHGMAVRGGSINSHLRIGLFHSSIIRPYHADFILSLDPLETSNNLHYLKPGGLIIENSPHPDEPNIRRVDASGSARKLGRIQLENVVMLGFAATMEGFPVSLEEIRELLRKHPDEKIRTANVAALELGADLS